MDNKSIAQTFANNNLFKWNKTETIYRIKQTIHPLWMLYTHNILIVHKQITGLSTHSDERQPKYTFKVEPIFFYIMKIHCWRIINNTDLKKHKRSTVTAWKDTYII